METGDISEFVCPIHREEPATAYCSKHDQRLCTKCLLGTHKYCVHEGKVEDISDTAKRLEKEIPQTIRTYNHLATNSEQWREKYSSTLQLLGETENRLINGIKQMKHQMIEQTEKLAEDATEMVNSVIEDHRNMVKHDLTQLEEITRKVKGIHSRVERCKEARENGAGELLYVLKYVKNLNSEFESTELIDRNLKFHFYISDELQFMRKNLISFGELCVEDPNCKNTGMISRRPSRVSLVNMDHFSDDEIDSSVFVMPSTKHANIKDQSIYCSIHVEQVTPCPKPPPLPDMHPEMPVKEQLKDENLKFKTLPRMRPPHHPSEVQKSNSFCNKQNATEPLPIPPLPKKRSGARLSTHSENTEETLQNESDNVNMSGEKTANESNKNCEVVSETQKLGEGIENQNLPHVKPTMTGNLVQMFERKGTDEPNKFRPKIAKKPFSNSNNVLAKANYDSDGSVNRVKDSHVLTGSVDKIPTIPKMHRLRYNINKRIESIVSESGDVTRYSDNEFVQSNYEMPSQKASSLIDLSGKNTLSIATFGGSSDSSIDSSPSCFSDISSSASVVSTESRNVDSSVSEETNENITHYDKKNQMQMRIVPPLDTKSRKSVAFNLLSTFSVQDDTPKSPSVLQHSTINGIAVTNSGVLLICDTENNCLQLFNDSGAPLFDYRIREPYSCCTVRNEVVAVTSKDRKSLCIFDISDSKILCKQEQIVAADTEVFGVGYTKGFFGVCCGDRVAILTESLQPYRVVKPIVMLKKKRSKTYFDEVRYIAMEWSKLGFFIYTSEHKIDRVSCVVVGSRDRPVWHCHVGKPKSLVIFKENVIVAGKHKLVVLDAASGQRLREIHHEVPSHPVHMVVLNEWLYISKTSTSGADSRNIRKICLS